MRPKRVEDGLRHITHEGQAAQPIVHNDDLRKTVLGIDDAVGQAPHGLDEVAPLANDPGPAHDAVTRSPRHCDVAGGIGLTVSGKWGEGLHPGMDLGGVDEDAVG